MSDGWGKQRSGGAMVEFAITLPLLSLLMFGIIEAGQAWRQEQVLATAAREGARVGAIYNASYTSLTVDSVTKAYLVAGGIDPVQDTSVHVASFNLNMSCSTTPCPPNDSVAITMILKFPVLSRLTGGLLPRYRRVTAAAVFHNE